MGPAIRDCDIAGLVNDFGNTGHFCSGKFSFKHSRIAVRPSTGLGHLVVHGIFMIQLRNGAGIAFVEASDELFNYLTWAHETVFSDPWAHMLRYEKSGLADFEMSPRRFAGALVNVRPWQSECPSTDLYVAILGHLAAAQLPLGDALETGPL